MVQAQVAAVRARATMKRRKTSVVFKAVAEVNGGTSSAQTEDGELTGWEELDRTADTPDDGEPGEARVGEGERGHVQHCACYAPGVGQ